MPQYTLMKHQAAAVKFLDEMDGVGALLFDPGVGKTGSTLAWVDKMADTYGEMRVLVVSPLTAADTWVLQAAPFMDSPVKARVFAGRSKGTNDILADLRKAKSWANVPAAKISVDHPGIRSKQVSGNRVTIASISAGAVSSYCRDRNATMRLLRAVRAYAPHLIVVDESHIIKSSTANISKTMYQMGQLAPHRIILTGTVMPHSALDVYGQWLFMAPWTFSHEHGTEPYTTKPSTMTTADKIAVSPWPFGHFKDRYTNSGGYKGKAIDKDNPYNQATIAELHDRVAERSMVVRKEDALDLPPTNDVEVHFTLSPKEQTFYDDMRDELVAELESGELIEAPNALAKIMKLRQIAAGFVKDTETDEVHVVGDSLQKAVREVVNTQLLGENRIVVFAYFQRECAMLAESLKRSGRTVEVITGKTKSDERLAIRQRFADVTGHPEQVVLVAQARTMSISVNELVTAQHAVYASMSERSNDWVQSRGRLDRNGQTKPVTFWNVWSPGTVGEVMLKTHRMRGDMEKELLDYIAATRKAVLA